MRRTFSIVFFLSVLACGLLLYWRGGKQQLKPFGEAPIAGTPAAVSPPPPRLVPVVPSREADNDAGHLALDEDSLMQQIRDSLLSNPKLAETLAREGRQRFPDSAVADERDAFLVFSLLNQRRFERARIAARYYFDHHQGGRFAERLSALTGVHSRPTGPSP